MKAIKSVERNDDARKASKLVENIHKKLKKSERILFEKEV